jgi:SAM-dependent methyltransferase
MSAPASEQAAIACPLCGGPVRPWATKSRGGHAYRYDRCRACDFTFVNPRPTRAWLDDHYRSGDPRPVTVAPPFASAADVPDPGPWPTRAVAETVAANPLGRRFLDVGAGSGWFASAAVRAGLTVAALELDPADLAQLRQLPNVTAVAAGLEAFDAPPASFDFVFMSHVLEHAHDPRAWVQRAAELLAGGGVLSVLVPHFNSVYRLVGGTRDPYFFPPEHLNHFNRRSLGRLAQSCGLTPVRWRTLGDFPADAITRRVQLPRPVAAAVRAAAACVGLAVECTTRVTGTGPVLWMLATRNR